MKKKYKLFIWTEFEPEYTNGLAFAIAPNEAMAKKMIEKQCELGVWKWGKLEVREIDIKVARCVSGGG